jgi:calreticulin
LIHFCLSKIYFQETFANQTNEWVESRAPNLCKWSLTPGNLYVDKIKSKGIRSFKIGLKTMDDSKQYAISSNFNQELARAKKFIVQYTVKFEQNIDCGGGYIKSISSDFDPLYFDKDSKFEIMFGPDICGANKNTITKINSGGVVYVGKDLNASGDQLTRNFKLIQNCIVWFSKTIDMKLETIMLLNQEVE